MTVVKAEQVYLDRAVVPIRILSGIEGMHMIKKALSRQNRIRIGTKNGQT